MSDPTTAPRRADRPDRDRRRAARVVVWSQRALVLIGFACLAAYASACANRAIVQSEEKHLFEEQILRALTLEQHDRSEWSARRSEAFEASRERAAEALGRLEIPDASVSVMVLEGTDETTLDRAVGHIPGTAGLGEPGNLGIAGHRDGFFRGLRHLDSGDEITLATLDGVTRYRVSEIRIVDPADVEVLDPTPTPTITLVTCYPFYFVGSAPRRYIVHGEQVSFEPWTSETAATFLGNELAQR